MARETIQENLLEELTRLVGRPGPVLHDALARMLRVLSCELEADELGRLAVFPLTAWHALAPTSEPLRQLWSAALSAGLTAEEVFTALAVLDDHVRRGYGADAWLCVRDWAPRMIGRYDLGPADARSASRARDAQPAAL